MATLRTRLCRRFANHYTNSFARGCRAFNLSRPPTPQLSPRKTALQSVIERVPLKENGVIYGVLAGRQYRPQTPATFVGGCGNPYKHHSRDKHASPPRLQAFAPCCSCMYLLLPKHPKDWSSLAQGQPKERGRNNTLRVI